jgi:hypothetical protein
MRQSHPKAEAKYNTSERGYVCFVCKNKKRREFLIKFFGTLGVGLATAAYFILRFLSRVNRSRSSPSPDSSE